VRNVEMTRLTCLSMYVRVILVGAASGIPVLLFLFVSG